MSVKGPAPRAYWILSGILCLCTLVALFITAWKIRQEKVEARIGGREAEPSDTDRPRKIPIARGKFARAGHFKIGYVREATLAVLDLNSRCLVSYPGLKEGERRAWQELQLAWVAGDSTSCVVQVEFRPGSPCRGPGEYEDLKPGLRIELDPDVHLTVERWDPSKPEVYLAGPTGSAGLAEGGVFEVAPYVARLTGKLLRVERH
jgi:hypothetical protein